MGWDCPRTTLATGRPVGRPYVEGAHGDWETTTVGGGLRGWLGLGCLFQLLPESQQHRIAIPTPIAANRDFRPFHTGVEHHPDAEGVPHN